MLLLMMALTMTAIAAGSGNTDSESSTADQDPSQSREGLTYTKRNGFYSVTGYTGKDNHLIIPESVNGIQVCYIEPYAFTENRSLTGVSLPDTLKEIGEFAFADCHWLSEVEIPASVTTIAPGAFLDCPGLKKLTVEGGNPVYHSAGNCIIETAERRLVLGCQTSVIPNNDTVRAIGSFAFAGCTNLTEIDLPDTLGIIESSAFSNCVNLKGVTFTEAFSILDAYAFENCKSLTEIHLPTWMLAIREGVFAGCTALRSLTVDSRCPYYYSKGNCIIEIESQTLIAGCQTSVMPQDGSLRAIGAAAFSGMDRLTGIVIPDGVTGIGLSAFRECRALTRMILPDSVKHIDALAFQNCSSITELTIHGRHVVIAEEVLSGCQSLTHVSVSTKTIEKNLTNSSPSVMKRVTVTYAETGEATESTVANTTTLTEATITTEMETAIEPAEATETGFSVLLWLLVGVALLLALFLAILFVGMRSSY